MPYYGVVMPDTDLTTINFRAPKRLRRELEKQAQEQSRTLSGHIRHLLDRTLPKRNRKENKTPA